MNSILQLTDGSKRRWCPIAPKYADVLVFVKHHLLYGPSPLLGNDVSD